jgi:hypothetical protein
MKDQAPHGEDSNPTLFAIIDEGLPGDFHLSQVQNDDIGAYRKRKLVPNVTEVVPHSASECMHPREQREITFQCCQSGASHHPSLILLVLHLDMATLI